VRRLGALFNQIRTMPSMQLRKKLPVIATLLSLGGLTGVAMNAGGSRKRDHGAVPVADIRTVTMQQTIHRYKHVGIGGPSNGSWPVGGGVATVGHRIAVAVHTRASGAKATSKALSSGGHSNVKSGPSGTHRTVGKHQPAGGGVRSATPTTRSSGSSASSGSKGHGSGGGANNPPAGGNPTTKPSGSSSETTGTSTPTAPTPPTTKPSGAPPSGESGGGTPTTPTPPPTTKPSGAPEGGGSGGGSGEEGGGKNKGGGGHGDD
jgi:hypothetical protein